MTAEKLVTKTSKGFAVREWHKTRDRNEVFDCRVYATAALKLLNPNLARMAKRSSVVAPPADPPEPQDPAQAPAPAPAHHIGKTAVKLMQAMEAIQKARAASPPPAENPPEEPDAPSPQSAPKRAKSRRRRNGGGWVNGW